MVATAFINVYAYVISCNISSKVTTLELSFRQRVQVVNSNRENGAHRNSAKCSMDKILHLPPHWTRLLVLQIPCRHIQTCTSYPSLAKSVSKSSRSQLKNNMHGSIYLSCTFRPHSADRVAQKWEVLGGERQCERLGFVEPNFLFVLTCNLCIKFDEDFMGPDKYQSESLPGVF